MNRYITNAMDEFHSASQEFASLTNINTELKTVISVDTRNVVKITIGERTESFTIKEGELEAFIRLRTEKLRAYIQFEKQEIDYDELNRKLNDIAERASRMYVEGE